MPAVAISSGSLIFQDEQVSTATRGVLSLNGTATPGIMVNIRNQGTVIGTALADSTGAWQFSSNQSLPFWAPPISYLLSASVEDGGSVASTFSIYARGSAGVANRFAFSNTEFVSTQQSQFGVSLTTVTNHYTIGGTLLSQETVTSSRGSASVRIVNVPDANGVTVVDIYSTNIGYRTDTLRNYYDSAFHILKQETYSPSGQLLRILTAPDSAGQMNETVFAGAYFTTTTYLGSQRVYANSYDPDGHILSQERFDANGQRLSVTTAPDEAGNLKALLFAGGQNMATVEYGNGVETVLYAGHRGDLATDTTQSATYRLYTGVGIQPVEFTPGAVRAYDTFIFVHAYNSASRMMIVGFDSGDRVILDGYGTNPYGFTETTAGVTLTLSDGTIVLFDGVAHVADLHITLTGTGSGSAPLAVLSADDTAILHDLGALDPASIEGASPADSPSAHGHAPDVQIMLHDIVLPTDDVFIAFDVPIDSLKLSPQTLPAAEWEVAATPEHFPADVLPPPSDYPGFLFVHADLIEFNLVSTPDQSPLGW